jgi:hypothetical protein
MLAPSEAQYGAATGRDRPDWITRIER